MKFKPGDIITLVVYRRMRITPAYIGYVGDVTDKHYTIYWTIGGPAPYPIVLVDPFYTLQTDILREEE